MTITHEAHLGESMPNINLSPEILNSSETINTLDPASAFKQLIDKYDAQLADLGVFMEPFVNKPFVNKVKLEDTKPIDLLTLDNRSDLARPFTAHTPTEQRTSTVETKKWYTSTGLRALAKRAIFNTGSPQPSGLSSYIQFAKEYEARRQKIESRQNATPLSERFPQLKTLGEAAKRAIFHTSQPSERFHNLSNAVKSAVFHTSRPSERSRTISDALKRAVTYNPKVKPAVINNNYPAWASAEEARDNGRAQAANKKWVGVVAAIGLVAGISVVKAGDSGDSSADSFRMPTANTIELSGLPQAFATPETSVVEVVASSYDTPSPVIQDGSTNSRAAFEINDAVYDDLFAFVDAPIAALQAEAVTIPQEQEVTPVEISTSPLALDFENLDTTYTYKLMGDLGVAPELQQEMLARLINEYNQLNGTSYFFEDHRIYVGVGERYISPTELPYLNRFVISKIIPAFA